VSLSADGLSKQAQWISPSMRRHSSSAEITPQNSSDM